ncbi:ornithine decarboxylase [Escherichia coli]|uniref:ornithine decarboxylase n=1 Tax=Escherichia coli TaxID=562 RepID=UPI000B7EE449|nr:ornithine decarboxylase [Escherichia coli]
MSRKQLALFEPTLVVQALKEAVKKLNPQAQWRNPVMFIVWIGSLLTTCISIAMASGAMPGNALFSAAISGWLWVTVLFANFAEALAEGRSKAQANSLKGVKKTAFARKLREPKYGAAADKVPADQLRKGDIVLVEAGDIIPCDGEVIEGGASVDESAITGESAPVIRESGGDFASVTGGTRILSDWLVIECSVKTYFVLNGTSSSNKVVLNALLTPGDLVLFDRNNHKSNHHGALLQAGATPVYLETARNPYGFIGGIDAHCFEESYLRELITEVAPQRAKEARPFRLAVIQLGTYDGTIYNARQVVDKIGHLCDYILFDSAWVGYEQFIPMMADCSPLLLDLNENDPGILVTQSVHKQQAGFSQTSQIHKKDSHIKGQQRYVPHKRMNNAFMMHASTSPFYPLFAALDINAKMHEGVSGRNMWMDCVVNGINARKLILDNCQHIRPFVPELVDGKPWQSYETAQIAVDLRFFQFVPGEHWHSFEGYAENQYFVDPCKLLLTTPGIDARNGEYEAFGVPATILANFLRENGVVPEKCDLNSILFLLTPAEDMAKLQQLVALLVRFEKLLESDAPLAEVLPSIYKQHEERYAGYTLRQLCQEMHDLYARHNVKQLQKEMFRKEHFPRVSMNPQEANYAYLRGEVELVRLPDAEGRIAAEGALPYPPGVLCVVPGEIWGGAVLRYFSALEEGINLLPGFAPELQGVYIEEHDGRKQVWCYVIKPRDAQSTLLKGEKL